MTDPTMARSDRPAVSIVMVTWNGWAWTRQALAAIGLATDVEHEVIVVDNGSTDGSPESVRRLHPDVRLIANADNRGYSAANNQGIDASAGRYVFLLNSDTEVEAGSLRALVDYGDAHSGVGILGPRLLNTDGTLQPSGGRFPTPLSTTLNLFGVDRLIGRPRYGTRRDYSKAVPVDEVSGAAMMVRREVIEQVGKLDESFAWGYEDVDLCRRAQRAGWQVHYVPAAVVRHEWGASRRQAPAATVVMAVNGRRHYFDKHYGSTAAGFVTGATVVSQLLRSGAFAVAGVADRRLRSRASVEWEVLTRLVGRRA
jgi:GT2 family glycosyltransferase